MVTLPRIQELSGRRVLLTGLVVLVVNAVMYWPLVGVRYLGYWGSNEGAFLALARMQLGGGFGAEIGRAHV